MAQIYQAFTLKKDIEKRNKELLDEAKEEFDTSLKSTKEEFSKKLEDRITDYDYKVQAGIYLSMGLDQYHIGHYIVALEYLNCALKNINKCDEKTNLEIILGGIKKIYKKNTLKGIDKNIQKDLIAGLLKTDLPSKIEMIEYFSSLPIKEETK